MTPIPKIEIPSSNETVKVSIIDTSCRVKKLPSAAFMLPTLPGFELLAGASWAFKVEHGAKDVLLFDLGARKDLWNLPKIVQEQFGQVSAEFAVDKNVVDILKDNGDDPAGIDAIIWSHYHMDHTGDPSTFPRSTALVVGPGFKKAFVPAFPTVQDSPVSENAWEGRELREIDFDAEGKGLKIGEYQAFDYFDDGSFYLINSPGHATGHMSALARTTADPPTFILMGGDVAHQCGEFRPTEFIPLPDDIEPTPFGHPHKQGVGPCAGAIFEKIHPKNSRTEPFMTATGFIHDDPAAACESVTKLLPLDSQDNIFSIVAHDMSVFDVVDYYPKSANDWKKKGWKEQSFWRFLRDYDTSKVE